MSIGLLVFGNPSYAQDSMGTHVDSVQAAIRSSPSRMKGHFGSPMNQFHGF